MSQTTNSTTELRYLGVDLHKRYLVIGGVNVRQEMVLTPRRVELEAWPVWAKGHLQTTEVLVVEATGYTWAFYDTVVQRWPAWKWPMLASCPGSARPESKPISRT